MNRSRGHLNIPRVGMKYPYSILLGAWDLIRIKTKEKYYHTQNDDMKVEMFTPKEPLIGDNTF